MKHLNCPRDGCQISSTEKCLEGFDPATTCPYVSRTLSEIEVETPIETSEFVDLPKGEGLTESQAADVAKQSVTRLVVLAGPSASGKTTILTALFEAFLDAPFGNFLFAGSRTLVGFERRCHDARTASLRTEAHTPITRVDRPEFLHLKLVSAAGSLLGPQNLLLSDISGERFRTLQDSAAAVKEMSVLRRADHFCLLLDGEKLTDATQRHAMQNNVRMLLRSIVEATVLPQRCKIEILFSKWDLILTRDDRSAISSFISGIKDIFRAVVKDANGLEFFEIAARPTNTRVPYAFGLPTLLRHWLEEPPVPQATLYLPELHADSREEARYVNSVVKSQRLGDFYDVRWV